MVDEDLVELPVRLRSVAFDHGTSGVGLVRCPRQGRTIDAARCIVCASKRASMWDTSKGGSVVCAPGGSVSSPKRLDARTDLAEAAARCRLYELVERVIFCVRPETRLSVASQLLRDRGLRAVPVVDDDVGLVGVLSRTDLIAAPSDALVRDVMSDKVHSLPEDAPVGHAIALMAFERIHEVAVVTEEGEVLGLLHASDALRWVSERMGYVTTPP